LAGTAITSTQQKDPDRLLMYERTRSAHLQLAENRTTKKQTIMKITMLASLFAPTTAFVAPATRFVGRYTTRAFSGSSSLMANPKG